MDFVSLKNQVLRCMPLLLGLGVLVHSTLSRAQSVTALTITSNVLSLQIGQTAKMSAIATYSDGSSSNVSSGASWSSQDFRIVSVSSGGVVSAAASGTVAITAAYQGQMTSIAITSSIGNVQWSGPLTITQGGTYSGAWRSLDPNQPAVTVATTAPVVIENSYLSGPNDLISDPYYANSLTVRNVIGIGTNANVAGQAAGLFVNAQDPVLLDVENCYFENVRYFVWVRGYAGNRDGSQTITILNNRGRNMLGVESDGNNGYLPGETNWAWSHAIQISNVNEVPGMQIAWNEIIDYPYVSLVNEIINIYDSGGTASSPVLIHDNYLEGAYAWNPPVDAYNGGGLVTDGSGGDTAQTASAYLKVYNNQIIGTVNVGIEFGSGHDNVAYNNRVISSGLLPDGTEIVSQNVGLTIYDVYGNISNGSMYNNVMYDNTVGWMCWAARCAWDGYRNDTWFPDDGNDYAANVSRPAGAIPLQAEFTEYFDWQAKLRATGTVVGPPALAQYVRGGSGIAK